MTPAKTTKVPAASPTTITTEAGEEEDQEKEKE